MATKSKRHTHKYNRINLAFSKVWACAHPDCSHYMPLHMEELVNGKASICWSCGDKMILDSDNMRMDKPTCPDCRGLTAPELDDFLTSKGL